MAASVANIEMKERRSEFRLLFYALLLAAAYVGLNIALSQSEAAAMLFAGFGLLGFSTFRTAFGGGAAG